MADHKNRTNDEAAKPAKRPGHDKHGRPGLRMGDHVFSTPAQPKVTGTAPASAGQPASGRSAGSGTMPSEERGQE